jgi:hypothetical protein
MRTINQYIIENKRKVKLNLRTVNVNVGARPIRVIWTHEMVQDISAFHNIDAEAEFTRVLTEEIDRVILNDLMGNNFLHQLEPVIVNNPLIGVSSRYASVQVNQNFYGEINLSGLNE